MTYINNAAWLTAEKVIPLEIKSAPCAPPDPDTLLIRVHAIAINPVDWMLQYDAFFPLKYPFVLGQDVAGEVVEVGDSVEGFARGDRIIGQCTALASSKASEGAFQEYSQLHKNLVCKISDDLSYADAVVVPLGFSTASIGLYSDDDLRLDLPVPGDTPSGDKGTLLIWGGATSVGLNAIQLATRSGYKVYATSSPTQFSLIKSLGAIEVFDYKSESILDDLKAATSGQTLVGALDCACKSGSTSTLSNVLVASSDSRLFVSCVLPNQETLPSGVSTNFIKGVALRYDDAKSRALWGTFLPRTLADGSYKALPTATIVGNGLEQLQEAMEVQRKGVSAKKVVITIGE
jgi:NADPH:quinone reductase-like Zn-dependent oxidoreductase